MSSASNVVFADAIRETAKAMDRLASDDAVSRLDTIAKSLGRIDTEAGTVVFDNDDGGTEGVSDWLRREVGKLPSAGHVDQGHKFSGLTAAALSTVERIRRQDAADADAHAQALANTANPWAKATWNMTHQAIIKTRLPHVAANLKEQANV